MFKIVKTPNAHYELRWQSTSLETFSNLNDAGREIGQLLARRHGQPEIKVLCEYWDAQATPPILVGTRSHTGRPLRSLSHSAVVSQEPCPKGF